MFETITKFAAYLEHVSFLTYPITVMLGLLSAISALTCFAPLVPAIAGFVVSQGLTRKRMIIVPVFIMLGSIVTLVALGVAASLIGVTVQKSIGQYWKYFIGAVCIIVGLFVLQVIKIPTKIVIPKIQKKGYIAPFVFGLITGGVLGFGSSCCLPILPVVLTYAAVQGKPLHGALILGSFAIGQSIPIFAIGLFSDLLGKLLKRWVVYLRWIAGCLLLLAGIYFILRR